MQFFVILKIIRNFLKKVKFAFFFKLKLKNLSLNFGLMLTKTHFIVIIIFWGQSGYIVMSDSKKKSKYLFFEKKIRFTPFFVARTKTFGVEVMRHIQSVFIHLYLLKYIFISIPYTMGSFLR